MSEKNRSSDNARDKLFAFLKERAFRRGKVVLASGRESNFYFDMKPAMLDPDGANLLAELILQELQGVKADCIGGLEMGAVPLASAVAVMSQTMGWESAAFLVATNPARSRHPREMDNQRWKPTTATVLPRNPNRPPRAE